MSAGLQAENEALRAQLAAVGEELRAARQQLAVMEAASASGRRRPQLAERPVANSGAAWAAHHYLSIKDYDEMERRARVHASYPAIRAFSPVAFAQVNFPTRVAEEAELSRYADIMHEFLPRAEWLERKLYSETEARAILRLVGQIRDLTHSLYGRAVQPLMCLFLPIPILRAVEAIASARGRRLNVYEIGPGSGHLGAYLLNAGHRYAAMDICQALYLWQNRLMVTIADDCCEWAWLDGPGACFTQRATHVPWWHFARLHEVEPTPADIVICDAAMGEMDVFALPYILRVAKAMLARSDCGAFLFQNLGEERVNARAQVQSMLTSLGFQLRVIGGVTICTLAADLSDVFAADAMELAHLGAAGEQLVPAQDFLSVNESELLESYRFFQFIGYGV